MGKCCIVDCKSGYKSNTEKVSMFSAPRDPELRKKWENAISRQNYVVNKNTSVCEKHFAQDDIIRFWQSGSEATFIVKVPYKIPKLRENAIPSIFSGYTSTETKKRKPPLQRINVYQNKKKLKMEKDRETCFKSVVDNLPTTNNEKLYEEISDENPDEELSDEKLDEESSVEKLEEKSYENLYDKIKRLHNKGTLQSYCSWTDTTILTNKNIISSFNFSSFCVGHPFSVIEKSINISINGEVTFGVLSQKIDHQKLNIIPAKSLDDFTTNITDFENINVCHGGPLAENYPKSPTSLCVVNTIGRLQHINCCLIIKKKATSCMKCRRLENQLKMREKKPKDSAEGYLFLSPSKRQRSNCSFILKIQ